MLDPGLTLSHEIGHSKMLSEIDQFSNAENKDYAIYERNVEDVLDELQATIWAYVHHHNKLEYNDELLGIKQMADERNISDDKFLELLKMAADNVEEML